MGELGVFDAGAVFVFTRGSADKHDAIDMAQIWLFVKGKNIKTCYYENFKFYQVRSAETLDNQGI